MEIITALRTDIGITKQTNQDSMCLKVAESSKGKIVMGVVCDGMGGLSKGEVASASVIKAFSDWFENELPIHLEENDLNSIQYCWDIIIKDQNIRIADYGRNEKIQLGTTLTVILIIDKNFYIIGHVGDSRAYLITEDRLIQITEDQTVVAREIKKGNLTAQEAEIDSRRNVLLQCIGASKILEPDFIQGIPKEDTVWMLCSDGFRHLIAEEEIHRVFKPSVLSDEKIMIKNTEELIELNKQRKETDNISVLLLKII